jgi:hypothetical protein
MISRVNRFLNEAMIQATNFDMRLRVRVLSKLARLLQETKHEYAQGFGDGMILGLEQATEQNRLTEEMYIKYIDRTFPSVLIIRDLVMTWPGTNNLTHWVEDAVNYQE